MNGHFSRPSSPLPTAQSAFRFRLLDSDTWHEGQVEDLAEEGLAFLTDLPLEIGTYLEIALPGTADARMPAYVCVSARVLNRWPDLRAWIKTSYAPAEQFRGAA